MHTKLNTRLHTCFLGSGHVIRGGREVDQITSSSTSLHLFLLGEPVVLDHHARSKSNAEYLVLLSDGGPLHCGLDDQEDGGCSQVAMVLQGLPRGAQVLLGEVQLQVLRVEDIDDSLTAGMYSPVTVLEIEKRGVRYFIIF